MRPDEMQFDIYSIKSIHRLFEDSFIAAYKVIMILDHKCCLYELVDSSLTFFKMLSVVGFEGTNSLASSVFEVEDVTFSYFVEAVYLEVNFGGNWILCYFVHSFYLLPFQLS